MRYLLLLCGTSLLLSCAVSRPPAEPPTLATSADTLQHRDVALQLDTPASTPRPWWKPKPKPQQTIALPAGAQLQLPKKLGRGASLVVTLGDGNDVRTKTESDTRTKTDEKTKLTQGSSSATGAGAISSSTRKSTGVASGPASTASPVVTKQASAGPPWWLLLLVGAGLGAWLGAKFAPWLRWLPFLGLLLISTHGADAQLVEHRRRYSYKEARAVARDVCRARRHFTQVNRRERRHLRREYDQNQGYLRRVRRQRPPVSSLLQY